METSRKIRNFFKSKVLFLGVEHFFAMFPATILVPILINNHVGTTVIDVTLVLFTSGIGTLIFILLSKIILKILKKNEMAAVQASGLEANIPEIPAYLGSSFAYIGFTIYLMSAQTNPNVTPAMAYAYVGWSYIFAGVFMVFLSSLLFIFKDKIVKFFNFILPAPVIGPAISLIGLELASTAAADSGFLNANGVDTTAVAISLITLFVIICMTVIKHKRFKNTALLVGMIAGYIFAGAMNGFPEIDVFETSIINFPKTTFPLLYFPPNLLLLILSVIPVTLVIFTENISRITIITRMTEGFKENEAIFSKKNIDHFKASTICQGISITTAALLGSVPNTIYAENIAVMGLSNTEMLDQSKGKKENEKDKFIKKLYEPFSRIPFIIAAIFAILASFFGILNNILLSVPRPIIGGVELFLFGIISAPGIQLLVDQRVNYKKISNQILTASVLIAGVGGLSFNLNIVELKGMSLGLIVGIVLNLFMKLLQWLGKLNEYTSFEELLEVCFSNLKNGAKILYLGEGFKLDKQGRQSYKSIAHEVDRANEETVDNIEFKNMSTGSLLAVLNGNRENITIGKIRYPAEAIKNIIKNYSEAVIVDNEDRLIFRIEKTVNKLYIHFNVLYLGEERAQKLINDYEEVDTIKDKDIISIPINEQIPLRKIEAFIRAIIFETKEILAKADE